MLVAQFDDVHRGSIADIGGVRAWPVGNFLMSVSQDRTVNPKRATLETGCHLLAISGSVEHLGICNRDWKVAETLRTRSAEPKCVDPSVSDRAALTAAYRYQHISNGDQCSMNIGINSSAVVVGISYFFP